MSVNRLPCIQRRASNRQALVGYGTAAPAGSVILVRIFSKFRIILQIWE